MVEGDQRCKEIEELLRWVVLRLREMTVWMDHVFMLRFLKEVDVLWRSSEGIHEDTLLSFTQFHPSKDQIVHIRPYNVRGGGMKKWRNKMVEE